MYHGRAWPVLNEYEAKFWKKYKPVVLWQFQNISVCNLLRVTLIELFGSLTNILISVYFYLIGF